MIDVAGLRKGYGEKLLIEDLQEAPDAGSMAMGDTVALGYVDQEREWVKWTERTKTLNG